MPSNQGRDIDQVLNDVDYTDLETADQALWQAARSHPRGATCSCPGIKFLTVLYERGYRLTKPTVPSPKEPQ